MPQGLIALHGSAITHELRVEYAHNTVDLMRGLMFRKTIAPFDGMVFDFGMEKPVEMWMKNTDIPLDMVFFDAQKTLVHIHRNAVPQSEAIIASPHLAKYVLEIDAGKAEAMHLQIGDRFEWLENPE